MVGGGSAGSTAAIASRARRRAHAAHRRAAVPRRDLDRGARHVLRLLHAGHRHRARSSAGSPTTWWPGCASSGRSSSARTPTAPGPGSPTSPSTSRSSGSGSSRTPAPGSCSTRRSSGRRSATGASTSLTVATRAGLRQVRARVVVDASGDADLSHHAGFGYELAGSEAPAQTATTTFRMANVDMAARRTIDKDRLHALMAEAAADGYDLPRREGSDHVTPIDGVTATIMTRLDQVRRDRRRPGPQRHRPRAPDRARDPRPAAGARVRAVPRRPRAGVRRRVAGRARDTARRPRDPPRLRRLPGDRRRRPVGARPSTTRSACAAPRSRTTTAAPTAARPGATCPMAQAVGIPLRSLIVRDGTNALVAGRCFSATHDAHASIRSMAQCMAMGQAAGTTAALAAAGVGRPSAMSRWPSCRTGFARPARSCRSRPSARSRDDGRPHGPRRHRPVADLGVTYSHEHLVIDGGRPVEMNPDFDLGDVDRMVPEVEAAIGARPARRRRRDAVRLRAQRATSSPSCRGGPGSTSSPRPGSTTSATTAPTTGA